MDHLACFLPGTIAMALHHGLVPRGEGHEEVADGILKTCIDMYRMTPSGIAPEILSLGPGNTPEVRRNDRHNLLRPETAESLYFMGVLTGKPRYRRAAWDMFAAFRAGSRASDGAYTSLDDVYAQPSRRRDDMPTFWLAETLKYLFLNFAPPTLLPLDEWVFNTEAHPLRVFPRGAEAAGAAAAAAAAEQAKVASLVAQLQGQEQAALEQMRARVAQRQARLASSSGRRYVGRSQSPFSNRWAKRTGIRAPERRASLREERKGRMLELEEKLRRVHGATRDSSGHVLKAPSRAGARLRQSPSQTST